jgi:ArsR family transcriptional regulator
MRLAQYADTLSLLGDESRLRLSVLLHERELRVTDLVRVTGIAQSRVSTHLGKLREAGFVRDRRDGPQAFYALAGDAIPAAARAVITEAAASTDPTLEGDKKRLRALDHPRKSDGKGGLDALAGEMERHYSPGRTWQSLAVGLGALLRLGDVLDVGSGDGAAASLFATQCRSLTCIDASPRMAAAAAARLGALAHVRAEVADVHDLPYRAATFDTVVLFHTLTYAERPPRALEECARVLRPKGRIVVLTLAQHDERELTAPYGERHPGFSPRALRALLSSAGLEVITTEIASREAKKPHFKVVLAIADKPAAGRDKRAKRSKKS